MLIRFWLFKSPLYQKYNMVATKFCHLYAVVSISTNPTIKVNKKQFQYHTVNCNFQCMVWSTTISTYVNDLNTALICNSDPTVKTGLFNWVKKCLPWRDQQWRPCCLQQTSWRHQQSRGWWLGVRSSSQPMKRWCRLFGRLSIQLPFRFWSK